MGTTHRTGGYGWPTCLVSVRLLLALLALCALLGFAPAVAVAQDTRPVLLGFGDCYGATQRQHLGCDVAAEPGEEVLAPMVGSVSFVGWVPREEGVRVRAVTIRTADGALVSVSPLSQGSVSLGQEVVVGTPLGLVAETGDPSTADSHVHLSLRVSDRYVNPAHLVGMLFAPRPLGASKEPAQPQASAAPVTTAHKSAVRGVGAADPAAASEPIVEAQQEPTSVPAAKEQLMSVSQPTGTLVVALSPQVARANSLDQLSGAQAGAAGAAQEPLLAMDPAGGVATSQVAADRALIAWALFGIGAAIGLGVVLIGQSCRTAALVGWLTGLFAVRGNR